MANVNLEKVQAAIAKRRERDNFEATCERNWYREIFRSILMPNEVQKAINNRGIVRGEVILQDDVRTTHPEYKLEDMTVRIDPQALLNNQNRIETEVLPELVKELYGIDTEEDFFEDCYELVVDHSRLKFEIRIPVELWEE